MARHDSKATHLEGIPSPGVKVRNALARLYCGKGTEADEQIVAEHVKKTAALIRIARDGPTDLDEHHYPNTAFCD